MIHVPKVILLDTSNRIHSTDFCSRTDQFDSDMSTDLDYRIFIIRKLWRCSVRIKLDVVRNELLQPLALPLPSGLNLLLTCAETKSGRGPASAKKPT
jgi:hypothetical protein